MLNELNDILKKIFLKKNFLYFFSIFLSLFYLTLFSLTIYEFILSFEIKQKISLIFILILCASTDIGGYIFGKTIGGKKFTKISPNKTYAGIIGAFLFACIFGYLFFYYFNDFLNIKINIISFIIIISFVAQVGDLMISFLKRKANIKDTGNILPGHGGVLDRLDGILLALPTGIVLISI